MSGADLRQRFPCRILHCARIIGEFREIARWILSRHYAIAVETFSRSLAALRNYPDLFSCEREEDKPLANRTHPYPVRLP